MTPHVALLSADENQRRALCQGLQAAGWRTTALGSLSELEDYVGGRESLAVILDLDTVPLTNRTIKRLALDNPGIYLLGLSKERFHPELKDAICYYLYACINRPEGQEALEEELRYWLRTIEKNESTPGCPAQ